MNSNFLGTIGSWRNVADAARTTISKDAGDKEPSSSWKRRMLLSEHSPIRQILIRFKWSNLKSWISVHFVRHKFGIDHFVSTQRTDRTGIDRDNLLQSNFVTHEFLANQQAIIYISRKRLCKLSSNETRAAWKSFLDSIKDEHPELVSVCVADCLYRGWCYEYKSCGWFKTEAFNNKLNEYRKGINEK